MVFEAFRNKPFPTLYGENRSAVTVDVLEVGLIVAFVSIFFSLLLILPGVKDWRQGFSIVVRSFAALYVGLVILICNFGYEWQRGTVTSTVQYKQFVNVEVRAEIGLKIGLRGVNITLKAQDQNKSGLTAAGIKPPKIQIKNMTEEIDYNEHFNFGWDQQLNGFGPNAALFNREFREAQRRGVPLPILAVAEYFVLDGESIRWGRLYRQAGYYTHLMLWTAFPLWVLSCILILSVLVYGAIFLMLTGSCMLLACVIFVSIHTIEIELKVPFQQNDVLTVQYGWCFILTLVVGILCMLGGLVIIVAHMLFPIETASFFGTNLLEPEDIAEVEQSDADFDPLYACPEGGGPNASLSMKLKNKAGSWEGGRSGGMGHLTRQASGVSSGSNKSSSPYRSVMRRRSVHKRRPRTALYPTFVFQRTEANGVYSRQEPAYSVAATEESTIVLYDAVKMGGGRGQSAGRPAHNPPPPPHMQEAVPLQLKGQAMQPMYRDMSNTLPEMEETNPTMDASNAAPTPDNSRESTAVQHSYKEVHKERPSPVPVQRFASTRSTRETPQPLPREPKRLAYTKSDVGARHVTSKHHGNVHDISEV